MLHDFPFLLTSVFLWTVLILVFTLFVVLTSLVVRYFQSVTQSTLHSIIHTNEPNSQRRTKADKKSSRSFANLKLAVIISGLISSLEVKGLTNWCPPLQFHPHRTGAGEFKCFMGNEVPCDVKSPPGSIAYFKCPDFYKPETTQIVTCLSNGSWSSPLPKCVLDCGKRNPMVGLIVNGIVASPGSFPWQVAIYNFIEKRYEFWCGGSLISETAVITAAHCTWKVPAENLMFAFGKFRREFDCEENGVQKIKARRVEMLKSYQDVNGNYNGDLSVVVLEKPVSLNPSISPICLDWSQQLVEKQLEEGTLGVVSGWGLTENDTFSDFLRAIKVPVISDEKCIAEQQGDFKKFITFTSFCAGFNNGTGVCNGDSGGGLAFFDKESDRWYLQGLVSVSPRRRGTPYCNPNFYTVFTKVSMFAKWIESILQSEEENQRLDDSKNDLYAKHKFTKTNKIKASTSDVNRDVYHSIKKYFGNHKDNRKTNLPHTGGMLQLVPSHMHTNIGQELL